MLVTSTSPISAARPANGETPAPKGRQGRPPFLLITAHDYRSRRRASMHFIADELAGIGPTRFFSAGYSFLSLVSGDPRHDLESRANRIETVNGVECYFWKSAFHPFNLRRAWLDPVAAMTFELYARLSPPILDRWIRESGTIIFESGLPVIFFERAKRLNPDATMIYRASDDLATIGCAGYLTEVLERTAARYDHLVLPSPRLREMLPSGNSWFVPHGIDTQAFGVVGPSPFTAERNAVSVGSMLFDAGALTAAAELHPEVEFHVIGGGPGASALSAPNIRVHGEMAFADTLPYLAHADFGIAPYDGARVSPYLTDTSMKMMQYEYLGLPAVCPHSVVGRARGRFGYDPSDRPSIGRAIDAALALGRFEGSPMMGWRDVTRRMLDPTSFEGTAIEADPPTPKRNGHGS